MSMIQSDLLLGQEGAAGYVVERSLRFNASDSAYLSRTPASAGNRKTWTWAGWVKRSLLGVDQSLFSSYTGSASDEAYTDFRFADDNTLRFGGWYTAWRNTSQVFRDTSAWYHIVLAVDISNATASERVKLYVNGSQVTAFAAENNPATTSQFAINSTSSHNLGANVYYTSTTQKFSGYLADIHFIDGQALTPSSFTEVSATTGQLIPKVYTGSFGTNGFWLKFSDNSAATATTLGKDYSGNSNNWTPNNLSVTAGAGNDSLTDTPTSYGTDTGAGGEVRGNYCTLNPLSGKSTVTLANGNLERTGGANNKMGTFGMSSGKWYWEIVCNTLTGGAYNGITEYTDEPDAYSLNYMYTNSGGKYIGTTLSAYGASYAVGDVIGYAYDADAGSLTCYKNGVSQGVLVSGLAGKTLFPLTRTDSSAQMVCNFGQRPFAYPVSGFKALCDTNLPAPVVAKPSTVMDVKLYTGNGSTQTISGLGFSPDLVWVKGRSAAWNHTLTDTVRGDFLQLYTNTTDAEEGPYSNYISIGSSSFSVGNGAYVNTNNSTYAAWTWDAGTTTSSNGSGSITSQVRANPSAGFSIVTYTGNGTGGATVGHGGLVNLANGMIIVKRRDSAVNWFVGHGSQGWTKVFEGLNTTAAISTTSAAWNNTSPTSTVFTLGTETSMNGNGGTFVAYCFAPVAGYSSFGSYTGNGSASDGPFIYTGFKPRFFVFKRTDTTGQWIVVDTARSPYNPAILNLNLNLSDSEYSGYATEDFVCNGLKLRTSDANWNASGGTYVYFAFASNPFQYSRAG